MKIELLILFIFFTSIYSFNLRETKQSYDSYVFALQWPNGICSIYNCQNKLDRIEKNTLTIHGLWPTLINGKQLRDCTSGVIIKITNSELSHQMNRYWMSFQIDNEQFWSHEYNKHGYCMVEEKNWNNYENYFNSVINLYKKYKNLIQRAFPNQTASYTYEEMIEKIRKVIPNATFRLNCKSGVITEFLFFLNKNFEPSTKSRFKNLCKSGQIIFK